MGWECCFWHLVDWSTPQYSQQGIAGSTVSLVLRLRTPALSGCQISSDSRCALFWRHLDYNQLLWFLQTHCSPLSGRIQEDVSHHTHLRRCEKWRECGLWSQADQTDLDWPLPKPYGGGQIISPLQTSVLTWWLGTATPDSQECYEDFMKSHL